MKVLKRAVFVLIVCVLLLTPMLMTSSCGSNNGLVGRWQLQRGDWIYYFADADRIEFFADGRVIEHGYGETGTYTVSGDRLTVNGDWSGRQVFTFSISGNTLTLSDSDRDTAVYTRAR